MAQVEFKDVSKIYGTDITNRVVALNKASFKIEKGEFVVILGASGAGKSTLLNILGGMDLASSGQFFVNGKDIAKYSFKQLGLYRRSEIGFVFQFYNLMPNLTALENVQLAASVVKNKKDPKRVLKEVGLEKRMNNFPPQLSGGEQQRVAIARAISKNPTLLLCDEPTGALDSKTGVSVISLLYDIAKKQGKTVIIVTHNAKIAYLADHLIRIQDGSIIEDRLVKEPCKVEDVNW